MSISPIFIYISGPYSAPKIEKNQNVRQHIILQNIQKANNIALAIVKKGHIPFVPHTMMRDWGDVHQISRNKVLKVCHKWVEKCDALFFINSSDGADSEYNVAKDLNLTIYRNLDEIPNCDFFKN